MSITRENTPAPAPQTAPQTAPQSVPKSALRALLHSEAMGGLLLIAAAALAMLAANSSASSAYYHFFHDPLPWTPIAKLGDLHHWINDGLMAVFFFLVGLEIKREMVDGRLSTWEKRRLPVIAALAGMAFPAAIYLLLTRGTPGLADGWAIPAATDIAFAVGVLALLGKKAPTTLKLFLVTIAIVDDMGAVAIIALAYTAGIKTGWLGLAAAIMVVMHIAGKSGVRQGWVFTVLAVGLWYAVLQSGVHATVAGVLAAVTIPIKLTPGTPDAEDSLLHRMELALHGWSSWLIIPLFGFANAGVALGGLGLAAALSPLPVAIAAGLFVGKQLGIWLAVWGAVKLGIATRLRGVTWMQLWGVSMLCGIGFTMSLFIGVLAFPDEPLLVEQAKLGVLAGSLLSALGGYLLLRLAPLHPDHDVIEADASGEIDADGDVAELSEPA